MNMIQPSLNQSIGKAINHMQNVSHLSESIEEDVQAEKNDNNQSARRQSNY